MNFLIQLKSRLAALFRKRELDADMDDEMRSHIDSCHHQETNGEGRVFNMPQSSDR